MRRVVTTVRSIFAGSASTAREPDAPVAARSGESQRRVVITAHRGVRVGLDRDGARGEAAAGTNPADPADHP